MLELALQVIEAARALGLEKSGSLTRSMLPKLPLAMAIDGLRQAIEDFDRMTGSGLAAPALQSRPAFATPPQMDERGYVEHQRAMEATADLDAPVPEYGPEAEEALDMEPSTPSPSFHPTLSIPASSAEAARNYIDTCDLGDMELNDGAESVTDFLESLDAISDKLEYAVARVGWTPRLRNLAEAANIARRRMVVDVGQDETFVRVPAKSWANLNVAVAEAVTNMDHKMRFPEPSIAPRPSPPEHAYTPRVPGR